MVHQTFRIISTSWGFANLAHSVVLMRSGSDYGFSLSIFWGIYLAASLGTFFELRVGWAVTIIQTLAIWILLGMAVNESSIQLFSGVDLVHVAILNVMLGLFMPATTLLVLVVPCRSHLVWVFGRARRKRKRRQRWCLGM